LKLLKAVYLEANKDDKDKKYELDAAATLDPDIRKIEDRVMEEEVRSKLLDGVIGGYQKIVEGCSREMSRRIGEKTSSGD
jgi:hypothetical protein